MQLVVVMAVRKAVSAATITFTAISMNLFFIVCYFLLSHRSLRSHRSCPSRDERASSKQISQIKNPLAECEGIF